MENVSFTAGDVLTIIFFTFGIIGLAIQSWHRGLKSEHRIGSLEKRFDGHEINCREDKRTVYGKLDRLTKAVYVTVGARMARMLEEESEE